MTAKLIRLATALYPRAWRKRYSEEFAATLEDMPTQSWGTVWDVAKGALVMQIRQNGASMAHTAAKFGTAFMTLAFAGSLAIPNRYISNAAVDVRGTDRASVAVTVQRTLTAKRLQELIGKHHLYAADGAPIPAGDAFDTMRRNIGVSRLNESKGASRLEVSFQYSDPAVAQRVTADLTDAIIEENAQTNSGATLSVADSASKPVDSAFPNRTLIALMGLAGGALIGFVWSLLMRPRER